MTEPTDDLELVLDSTWVEEGELFDRVVVLDFFSRDCIDSSGDALMRTVGQTLRDRIIFKLENELGLKHGADYVFALYDNPYMIEGKWIVAPGHGAMKTVVRLKDEEHFTMFKLHYHGN